MTDKRINARLVSPLAYKSEYFINVEPDKKSEHNPKNPANKFGRSSFSLLTHVITLSITHFQFVKTNSETTFHINHSSSGGSAAAKAVLSVEPDREVFEVEMSLQP